MTTDCRGYELSTASPDAASAYDAATHSFACWRTDTLGRFDEAIEADPEFACPKLAKGWVLHTARSDHLRPTIIGLLDSAAPTLDADDSRERAYFEALTHAVNGRGIEASTTMEAYLAEHPLDLFAHRVTQFELFWNGRAAWMRDVVERAAGHWSEQAVDYGCFLSVRAFSSEEAGDYALAERCGRAAVEIDPSDCWGTHAIAHVLVMQGRIDEGVAWLEGLCGNWDAANQIKHHLWWHLCLFLLERGEHHRIVELLRTQIRNPDSPLVQAVPDATIDLQNVASLLLRLELRGVDVAAHWPMLASICAGRVNNHANAFSNAHDMMVLAATGQMAAAEELLRSIRSSGESGHDSLRISYRAAGTAVCEAVLAHRKCDYARVIALLAPVRHDLPLIGGSHAQRDVFYQLLIDSAHRVEPRLVPVFLDDVRRIGFDAVESRTLYRDMA